ncbi:PREDICTED: struthiocalcin-1-like isoform X4 [Poecilia mexicana]|uniref:struthiocalcin-1-like isoform X4 n=1 Tax=Poecilia mexicana TaxID=48701 RepID=UPI00072E1021|nr:PREDICTED: struthiocalcin-1-like isoform X4 [Poecilia mexicana]
MENIGDNDLYSTDTVNNDKYSPESEEAEEETTALTRSRLYLVGLGIFGALVAGTIIYMSVKMAVQRENISDLTTERKILIKERKMMEVQSQDNDKGCYTCPDDWILFRQKCYLFYDEPAPWKTWEQSRRFCQKNSSDLVVIDDLQEQKFVSKHIKYYNSEHNGYWMGLQNVNYNWTWLDGRIDTLGFWAKDLPYTPGSKVRVLPERNPTNSWKQGMTGFLNKFICFIHEAPDPGDVEPSN